MGNKFKFIKFIYMVFLHPVGRILLVSLLRPHLYCINSSLPTRELSQNDAGLGYIGTKAGMTTWLMPTGEAVPCTVIALEEGNIVTQIKTLEKDGHNAVQVGYKTAKYRNKPDMGHLNKACAPALRNLSEHRLSRRPEVKLGQKLNILELFQ